jgi:hypothetical protein
MATGTGRIVAMAFQTRTHGLRNQW